MDLRFLSYVSHENENLDPLQRTGRNLGDENGWIREDACVRETGLAIDFL